MNKLTYIWHDCFVFENDKLMIIFDYWKDPLTSADSLPLFIEYADKNKPIYVIVSHHHKDHYSKRIFEWCKLFNDIKYIISKDIAKYSRHILSDKSIYKGPKPNKDSVIILSAGERYIDKHITIEAYGSTDIGNSYVVMSKGMKLFHAGDLNAWIWKEQSTEEEIDKSINNYISILLQIKSIHIDFDIVMFPVDSRIGSDYYIGAKIFLQYFDVRHFFPMHFGLGDTPRQQLKYQLDATKTEYYANPTRGEYICLQSPYSTFLYPEII